MKKVLVYLCFIIFLFSCGSESFELYVNDKTINVEIADTTEERAKGLMNRKHLDENHGMLFVFDRDQLMSFWMKNTYVPLSIAFISSDGIIREIYDMKPLSEKPVKSEYYTRYALELPRGNFSRLGIKPGDHIDLSVINLP